MGDLRRFDEAELRRVFQAHNVFKQDTIPCHAAMAAAACFRPHLAAEVITPGFFGAPAGSAAPAKRHGHVPKNMHPVTEDAFVAAMNGPGGLVPSGSEEEHASFFFRLLEQTGGKTGAFHGSVAVPASLLPLEARDAPPLASLAYVATGCTFGQAKDRADSVLRTCKVPRMNAAETKKACAYATSQAPGVSKAAAKEEADAKKAAAADPAPAAA